MYYHMYYGFPLMILFWIGIIALFFWTINKIAQTNDIKKTTKDPIDILKRRYAKGEITKKEYEKIKKDLDEE